MASFNPLKIGNKLKRQQQHQKVKKQKETSKRDDRFRRRRHEDKNPELREARLAKNVPATIDSKRTWDEANADEEAEGRLGLSVDVLHTKRRKVEDEEKQVPDEINPEDHVGDVMDDEEPAAVSGAETGDDGELDELDSMLGSDDSDDEAETDAKQDPPDRAPSEAPSAAASAATATTDLNLTPDALIARFPSLFTPNTDIDPKVLVTTGLNATLHWEAQLLAPHQPLPRQRLHPPHRPLPQLQILHTRNLPLRHQPSLHARRDPERRAQKTQRSRHRPPPRRPHVPLQHLQLGRGRPTTRPRQPHEPLPGTNPQWLPHAARSPRRASLQIPLPAATRDPRSTGHHATQPTRLHFLPPASLRLPRQAGHGEEYPGHGRETDERR